MNKASMKTFIKHRWKIIFTILALLYLLLGVQLYLGELDLQRKFYVCPPEALPESDLCKPLKSGFDFSQMLSTIFFAPLWIGGILTGGIAFILPVFGLFALDKLWHAKKHTLALIPLAISLSILFLNVSLLLPVTIDSPGQFENIYFGLPVKFILQNQNYSPPQFPFTTYFSSVLENPTRVLWSGLAYSFLVILFVSFLALKALVSFFKSPYR